MDETSAGEARSSDEIDQGEIDRGEVDQWVRLEVADQVATIRVDRPKLNALNAAIQRRLGELAAECDRRSDIAAVVITGGPHVFAAGADIKEMVDMSYQDMVKHSSALQAGFTAIADLSKPVVAAVCGYALGGGCELALCADIRVAATDATFGQPEILLGVIPGAGGTQRLTRLVGPSRAKELIFTGRFVAADEALRIGLVDVVVEPDQVIETATAWAQQFVGGPALALRAAKEAIDRGSEVDLTTGLAIERQHFASLFATHDRTIGMQSFIDQGPGKAAFQGK